MIYESSVNMDRVLRLQARRRPGAKYRMGREHGEGDEG